MLNRIRKAITVFPMLATLPRVKYSSDSEHVVNFVMQYPLIRPGQIRSEFSQLASIIQQRRPKAAMEIGTLRGGTLFALCRLADPSATIISLDLPRGPFGGGYAWFQIPLLRRFAGPEQTLSLIRGNSHEDASKDGVRVALGGKQLDVLFIDGDHTYDGVKRDFEMYSPFVKRGGLIAFHDIVDHPPETGCEVNRFWNEIKRNFHHVEIVSQPSQGWAGIGVLTYS